MKAPCGRSQRNGHRHSLTWQQKRGNVGRLSDRCNSQLLWATAARALLLGQEPTLDGKPLVWAEARTYLDTCSAKWRQGIPA